MQIRQAKAAISSRVGRRFRAERFVRVAEVVRVEARGVGVDVADVEAVDGDAARAELEGEIADDALERGFRGAEHAVSGQITN